MTRSHLGQRVRLLATLAILFLGTASLSYATLTSYNPAGQPIGATYTVIFVTIEPINGESSNISSYNDLVQTEVSNDGLGSYGLNWCAVVSTATVNAIDNCSESYGGAVYNLYDGSLVANSFASFMDQPLLAPVTQFDGGAARTVWTGSDESGDASANPLGSPQVTVGYPNCCIQDGFDLTTNYDTSYNNLYAMAVITVESPEPAAGALVAAGMLGMLLAALRKRGIRIAPD
jgi:hypothetical protein